MNGHSTLWAIALMGISLKTHKLLWGRSGNQCAICTSRLIIDSENPNNDPSVVGDEAHIIARTESFTRGDYDALAGAERDQYSNLILLCKTHHKQVDDQSAHFTVERLRVTKAMHEREIQSHLSGPEKRQYEDDIIYSGYIDEWQKKADLDNWRYLCGHVCSADAPTLPKGWHKDEREFIRWVISRIWPRRYPPLENALINYKAVLQDFLNVFDRHTEHTKKSDDYFYTEKFYKIREWNPDRYHKLARQFDNHVDLVNDLFFELTRAANYICDRVRECLFPGYRLREGVLLVDRHYVGFELKTEYARVEYRGKERTKSPYPGLAKFKKIRYSRDYAISPNPQKPPVSIDEDA
jgi:HNH endonuclease